MNAEISFLLNLWALGPQVNPPHFALGWREFEYNEYCIDKAFIPWIEEVYQACSSDCLTFAVHKTFENLTKLAEDQDWEDIEEFLDTVNPNRLDPIILIAILTCLLKVRNQIPNFLDFYKSIADRVKETVKMSEGSRYIK